ncbi:MAG: hypothetical protein AAGI37_17865 [Planctomycetota bacterium]
MGTRIFDADDEMLDFVMRSGGVFVCDIQRTTGDGTFTLQISLDGGSNFVNYYNASGLLEQRTLSSSTPHGRLEALGFTDTVFRVVSSATGDTPNFTAKADRSVAAF